MRTGADSWSFETTGPWGLDAALCVRDALRLAIPPDPRVAPQLERPVPDARSLLTPDLLDRAAADWISWWEALLAEAGRPRGPDSTPGCIEWEPAEASVLRRVFLRLQDEIGAWMHTAPSGRGEAGPPWELTAQIAEEVAFDRGVPIGQVHGIAMLVSSAPWWTRPGPGVVICSRAAAKDPKIAPAIVRAAFDADMAV